MNVEEAYLMPVIYLCEVAFKFQRLFTTDSRKHFSRA